MSYEKIGAEIGRLVEEKQHAYGDSFSKSGDVMRILYPNGIAAEKLDDALTVVRVLDKLFRIATDRDALGESPWRDVAGYALLSVGRVESRDASRGLRTALEERLAEYERGGLIQDRPTASFDEESGRISACIPLTPLTLVLDDRFDEADLRAEDAPEPPAVPRAATMRPEAPPFIEREQVGATSARSALGHDFILNDTLDEAVP